MVHKSACNISPALSECGGVLIGGGRISVLARICSENDQLKQALQAARSAGAVLAMLHAGSPQKPAILPKASKLQSLTSECSIGIIVPVFSEKQLVEYATVAKGLYIPFWQMGNSSVLRVAAESGLPLFCSRQPGSSLEEWAQAVNSLEAAGAPSLVFLHEWGNETAEDVFDISVPSRLAELTLWPLVCVAGNKKQSKIDKTESLGDSRRGNTPLATVVAGADGVVIDLEIGKGLQQFQRLVLDLEMLEQSLERELVRLPSRFNEPGTDTSAANMKAVSAGNQKDAGKISEGRQYVSYQGERGAYSESAMRRFFGESSLLPLPCPSFHDVFVSVLDQRALFGVLPLENSLAGSVHENYDHFAAFSDIHIIGEIQIRIEHSLIVQPGTKLEDIRRVYSHPQGLAQCSRFLQRYPSWERVPFYDTAGSVQHISESAAAGEAAIAGAAAAEVYGMEVAKIGIENNPLNFTRFAVIARTDCQDERACSILAQKASMMFSAADKPGSLLRCMTHLSSQGLNLKKIESRPIFGKPWEYRFYVDVDVPEKIEQLDEALRLLQDDAEDIRLLGSYPVSSESDSGSNLVDA